MNSRFYQYPKNIKAEPYETAKGDLTTENREH